MQARQRGHKRATRRAGLSTAAGAGVGAAADAAPALAVRLCWAALQGTPGRGAARARPAPVAGLVRVGRSPLTGGALLGAPGRRRARARRAHVLGRGRLLQRGWRACQAHRPGVCGRGGCRRSGCSLRRRRGCSAGGRAAPRRGRRLLSMGSQRLCGAASQGWVSRSWSWCVRDVRPVSGVGPGQGRDTGATSFIVASYLCSGVPGICQVAAAAESHCQTRLRTLTCMHAWEARGQNRTTRCFGSGQVGFHGGRGAVTAACLCCRRVGAALQRALALQNLRCLHCLLHCKAHAQIHTPCQDVCQCECRSER